MLFVKPISAKETLQFMCPSHQDYRVCRSSILKLYHFFDALRFQCRIHRSLRRTLPMGLNWRYSTSLFTCSSYARTKLGCLRLFKAPHGFFSIPYCISVDSSMTIAFPCSFRCTIACKSTPEVYLGIRLFFLACKHWRQIAIQTFCTGDELFKRGPSNVTSRRF